MTDFKVGDIVMACSEIGEILYVFPETNDLYVKLPSSLFPWKCNAEDVMFIERKKEE